jgi:hypothetical protein
MMNYNAKSTKELNIASTGLVRSVKGLNRRLQVFLGDFMVSWRDGSSRENAPIDRLFKALAEDKAFNTTRVAMAKWLEENSNYRIVYNKDKDTYGVKYKKEEDRQEEDLFKSFFTTVFYESTGGESGNKGEYESLESFKKALIKSLEKAKKTFSDAEIAVILAEVAAGR